MSLNNARFQESLSRLNSLASADAAMRNTGLRHSVGDVTRRVRSVLMATSQLRDAAADPETMADLQLRLAASYAATPQLRQTWLESLARVQARAGHASEVAMCHVHVAALMAEVLKHTQEDFKISASDFERISPNVGVEEKLGPEETTAGKSSLLELYILFAGFQDQNLFLRSFHLIDQFLKETNAFIQSHYEQA
jgi:hypothetical protein